MTTDNDSPTVTGPELPGVANLEPPKDLFTSPPPEPETKPDSNAESDDKTDRGTEPSAEAQVVTEAPPLPAMTADHSDWRDVDDDPWQADEDAPPPVIGS